MTTNTPDTPRPITNCYWVLPNRFLAGEYPGDLDEAAARLKVDALVGAGVQAFIDLTEEDELSPYDHLLREHKARLVTHERFPIQDVSVPASRSEAAAVLDAIDGHLAGGRAVYVHCWGGVGRTGIIVGCWLARHGHRGNAALVRLTELWQQCPKSSTRVSPETMAQRRFITTWSEP